MKKLTTKSFKKVLVIFALITAFSGCQTNANTGANSSNSASSPSNGQNPESNASSGNSHTSFEDSDLEEMTALQFTKIMGNGINLGNTFDSSAASWVGYNSDTTSYETGWGQPVTTKAMMQAYKTAGFDSIRIPIAWTSTMDWVNGDYTINENYMNRIKEVVNWALDSGLIVMINDHWDYQWWGLFGNSQTQETAYKIFDAIWNQVGTAFKDYNYRLIFEAGNEEWGDRFNDSVNDHAKSDSEYVISSGGSLSEDQQYALITSLAQRFVDKIRAQGSKNAKRFLLIPGYSTNITKTCDSRYVMPSDSTNSVQKLLVSVHYYEPALYCIAETEVNWGGIKQPATTWGTTSEIKEQNAKFALMEKFTKAGYGVIVGEYAPAHLQVDANTKVRKNNDTVWITNVLDNCDKYNYCPFFWDCNSYFSKTGTLGFTGNYADVADVYKNRNYASESSN